MKNNLVSLVKDLFAIGAIQFGLFKLKLHEANPNAPRSPIYLNLRIIRSKPDVMRKVVSAYKYMISEKNLQFDLLADVPTAATPIVSILMDWTGIPMITPREPKTHGVPGNIDGKFESGKTVILIDDLITKADSKLGAANTLRNNGLLVKDILVLIDREQGGAEKLREEGYNLHSVFTITELMDALLMLGKVDKQKYDEVISYIREN